MPSSYRIKKTRDEISIRMVVEEIERFFGIYRIFLLKYFWTFFEILRVLGILGYI